MNPRSIEGVIWVCFWVCVGLSLLLFLGGCESDERRRERENMALVAICIKKHGSPVLDPQGRFQTCNFTYKGIIKKEAP